jgi:hypothetical protein
MRCFGAQGGTIFRRRVTSAGAQEQGSGEGDDASRKDSFHGGSEATCAAPMQHSTALDARGWRASDATVCEMGTIIRFLLFRVLGGRLALALAAIGFLRSRRRSRRSSDIARR